ncbi:MAG: carboxyl transferase [Clostridia bacterium]|nr:carboxyl transferase [Clostridia bacterium]
MDIQYSAADGNSAARQLLAGLFDSETFVEIDRLAMDGDKPAEAVAGYGTTDGAPVYAFAQDHDVCCGAVGAAQAKKITKIYELAAQNGAPIVAVYDSDGAKLGEGIDAMDAVADILLAANDLSGVVPQIAVIVGGCVGSAALLAQAADVTIAVEGSDYRLNVGDKQAKADIDVASVEEAFEKVKALLQALPANNLAAAPIYESAPSTGSCADVSGAIDAIADEGSVIALLDQDGVKTAFARVSGVSCGVVVLQADKLSGKPCAKAARFVQICDSFSLPVITFVDAAGFCCLKNAAKLSQAYAGATTAKITVIGGRAYGPVYIALAGKHAGADAVLAWPDASIGALAPETAVCLEWADRLAAMTDPTTQRAQLVEEYAKTVYAPQAAAAKGYVTDIVGPAETKARLSGLLEMLSGKRVTKLPKKHANMQL